MHEDNAADPLPPPLPWAVVWFEELLYLVGCLQMVLEGFALHTRLMTNSVSRRAACAPRAVFALSQHVNYE